MTLEGALLHDSTPAHKWGRFPNPSFTTPQRQPRPVRCFRHQVLVMCMHPFAKEALTLHLARSEGNEHYFGCNLMYYKILASSYQHLMAEAPKSRKC